MCNSVESRSFRFAVSSLEREHDSSFIVLTLVIVEGGGLRVKCTSYRAKLWSSRLIVVEGGGVCSSLFGTRLHCGPCLQALVLFLKVNFKVPAAFYTAVG